MNTLNLPIDLSERRSLLQKELSKVVQEQIETSMKNDIRELFNQYGINGKTVDIDWEFHPESDDEGGTIWFPSYINVSVDGKTIDTEEYTTKRKSNWSDDIYEYYLGEDISEMIHDWREDLYDNGIDEITVSLGGE